MLFPSFNYEKSRFERKFVVQDMHYPEIIQQVKNNSSSFSSLFYPRYINNIYFDTNDLDFFFDNISGKGSRKKARIRWYDNLFGQISKPVLEFKMREGMVGNKLSYPLSPFTLDETFSGKVISDVIRNSDLPDRVKSIMLMLKPSLLNRYHRQYFISFDRKFRITVDDELTYYGLNNSTNNYLEKHTSEDIIVELKYDHKYDGKEAAYVTNELPFRLTKSSKYVNGFELTHPYIAT